MVLASENLYLGYIPGEITPLHQLVFGSTLLIYNGHFLLRRPEAAGSMGWTRYHRAWHGLFLLIGALMAIRASLSLSSETRTWALVLGLVSLGYSLPLLPFRGGMRIRDLGIIKILVLTLVWTSVTSVLPLIHWGISPGEFPFEIALRFFFLFTLCLAFDLRDLQKDREQGIRTLPQGLGKKGTNQFMNLGIVLFLAFSLGQYLRHPHPYRLAAEFLTALATRWALAYSQKHPHHRTYLGLVDGMMLFYSSLILASASW